jgi:hypothetical protein
VGLINVLCVRNKSLKKLRLKTPWKPYICNEKHLRKHNLRCFIFDRMKRIWNPYIWIKMKAYYRLWSMMTSGKGWLEKEAWLALYKIISWKVCKFIETTNNAGGASIRAIRRTATHFAAHSTNVPARFSQGTRAGKPLESSGYRWHTPAYIYEKKIIRQK